MNSEQIHTRLKERFGDAIGERQTPAAGDGFIQVVPDALHAVCAFLRDDPDLKFDFLRLISGVDRTERLSSVYHLYSYPHGHSVVLRADIDRANPHVSSVMDLWAAAEWHEREAFDMMGIIYDGHADLRRILLPDDWEGYPLRKDYQPPAEYHGVPND